MAEDPTEWFQKELQKRGIVLTEQDYQEIIRKLEEREWISAQPELYKELRKKALDALSKVASTAQKQLEDIQKNVKEKIQLFPVKYNKSYNQMDVLASDASSYPIPLIISRLTMLSGITVRLPFKRKASILADVLVEDATMPEPEFRFIESAKRESMIPLSITHYIVNNTDDKIKFALVDGPLSISQWYKEVWKSEKVKEGVSELINSKNELMQLCKEKDILLLGVVKRSRATYFHNYFNLIDEFTDQFVFHSVLEYGNRTESISMRKAIQQWKPKAKPKELLINWLAYDIYGFYIKTSDHPLTPPIRVEYPEYLRDREDEIASYVLSTAVLSNDREFDGLPKAQCIAHRECKVTKKVMEEIFKEQLFRTTSQTGIQNILAPVRGYPIG
jgi:vacuolar-type H+-ATPase subunit H